MLKLFPLKSYVPSFIISCYATVARAMDGTLWAVGQGEHDRNMNLEPLPVFVHDLDWKTAIADENFVLEPVKLHCGMRMTKGYYRVRIFDSSIDKQFASESILTSPRTTYDDVCKEKYSLPAHCAYEVVIHEGVATIQPVDTRGIPNSGRLLELSEGWKHSLAIVEE